MLKTTVSYLLIFLSFLETAGKLITWILERVGYWKHQIQISALFLVLLGTIERLQCKNGAKRKSLARVVVLFKSQIIRINIKRI